MSTMSSSPDPSNMPDSHDSPTDDTIAAIATPPGVGGVGIVRLSGLLAFRSEERL